MTFVESTTPNITEPLVSAYPIDAGASGICIVETYF